MAKSKGKKIVFLLEQKLARWTLFDLLFHMKVYINTMKQQYEGADHFFPYNKIKKDFFFFYLDSLKNRSNKKGTREFRPEKKLIKGHISFFRGIF